MINNGITVQQAAEYLINADNILLLSHKNPDGDTVGSAGGLMHALKKLGNIDDRIHLISRSVIEPVQDLKVNHLGNHNPRLHTDEVLVALSICAATDPLAEIAMQQLEKLKGCQAHSTVILSQVDENLMKKLGVNLTCEPNYQTKKLYHK